MSTLTINQSANSARIRHLAAAVRWAAIATMAAVVFVSAYSVLNRTFDWKIRNAFGITIDASPSPGSTSDPQLALWLNLAQEIMLLYGLSRLARMMRACERGEIFSRRVSAHLRAFSAAIVFVELLSITVPLQIAAVHAALGRPQSELAFAIAGEQFWSLLVATLFLVLAQILQEGARLAEENASIV